MNFITDALASLWSNETAVILHLIITSSTGDWRKGIGSF